MQPQHIYKKLQDHKIPPLHLVPHHSVPGDWDFRRLSDWSVPDWYLDVSWYISAPSSGSLKNGRVGDDHIMAIIKYPGTSNLQQGIIETWIKPSTYTQNKLRVYLGIQLDHSVKIIENLGYLGTQEQLQHVIWWTTYDNQNNPSTRVLVEWWDVDHWQHVSQNDYPLLTGPNNEVAIGHYEHTTRQSRWDNTKLYIPAS